MYTGELVTGGIGILTTAASAIITWIFAKKKYYTEVDHNVIENLEKSLDFYEKLSTHNQEKLKELMEENKTLRREIDELRKQLQEITTNLYLDESYKNRVEVRKLQLKNQKENAKTKDRLSITEKDNRRRRKSSGETGAASSEK